MLMSNNLIIKHSIESRAVDKVIKRSYYFDCRLLNACSGRQNCLINVSEAIY